MALMTRLCGSLLDHPRRRAILAAVRAKPGCSFFDLMSDLAVRGNGVLEYHTQLLQRAGLLTARKVTHTVHYYDPTDGRTPDATARTAHAYHADPAYAPILDAVHQGGLHQRAIRETTTPNLSRQTIGYRLAQLVLHGVITCTKMGRYRFYTCPWHPTPTVTPATPGAPGGNTIPPNPPPPPTDTGVA